LEDLPEIFWFSEMTAPGGRKTGGRSALWVPGESWALIFPRKGGGIRGKCRVGNGIGIIKILYQIFNLLARQNPGGLFFIL
jgi:hypothetical protein